MASQKNRRKDRAQRSLVVKDGEIGLVTHGEFQSYTNFSMDIVHAVSSPKDAQPALFGYVYAIKTSSGQRSECFISTESSLTVRSFVRSASKSTASHLQAATITDKLWSLFVLNMAKDYEKSGEGYSQLTLVSRVGKQPDTSTWVLSPNVQLDQHGAVIPKDQWGFYWNEEYIHAVTKANIVPISIVTPLSPSPLVNLARITKRCLDNNFHSSMITLAGAAILLHYEQVLGLQDECPLVLCFSQSPGSGKSTTLRNVFSILGAEHHITGPDTHPAAIVSRAAGTTVPLGIDDVRSAKKAETISVQFFNGFAHHTCDSGDRKPCTSVIITSNSTFCNSERNSQRILHIPFFPPKKPTSPSQLRRYEMMLKQARIDASASFGVMVGLGNSITSEESQEYIDQVALPLVVDCLPSVHFRVQKCYALLLTAAKLLCEAIPPDVLRFEELEQFFVTTMSPLVGQLHSPSASILSAFIRDLIDNLQAMTPHEVLRMVRPEYKHKNIPCVALYMPSVREHCSLPPETEKQIKKVLKEAGAVVNGSALFLSNTSTCSTVSKATGVIKRSIVFVPHQEIAPDDLNKLKAVVQVDQSDPLQQVFSEDNESQSIGNDTNIDDHSPPDHCHNFEESNVSIQPVIDPLCLPEEELPIDNHNSPDTCHNFEESNVFIQPVIDPLCLPEEELPIDNHNSPDTCHNFKESNVSIQPMIDPLCHPEEELPLDTVNTSIDNHQEFIAPCRLIKLVPYDDSSDESDCGVQTHDSPSSKEDGASEQLVSTFVNAQALIRPIEKAAVLEEDTCQGMRGGKANGRGDGRGSRGGRRGKGSRGGGRGKGSRGGGRGSRVGGKDGGSRGGVRGRGSRSRGGGRARGSRGKSKSSDIVVDKNICPPHQCKLTPGEGLITWIQCETCNQWYHGYCANMTDEEIELLDTWVCC